MRTRYELIIYWSKDDAMISRFNASTL